jgi:hypothetical protein
VRPKPTYTLSLFTQATLRHQPEFFLDTVMPLR